MEERWREPAALAEQYAGMLYRLAYARTGSRADAEDVMQTVMLKLFEYDKEFESEAHLKHWLLRVSVNESRKLLRSFWRRVSVPLDDWRELEAPEHGERAELLEAVMALDPKYRLAIYLYYYEGLTVAETAAAMRANPSTVQTWLLRARARLRSALDEKAEDQEGSVYVRPQGIL